MFFRVVVAFLFLSALLRAAEIRGKVTNVDGGEPLDKVQVVVLETRATAQTADDGTFVIRDLPPGSYTLRFNAVAYRLLTVPFTLLGADEIKEFDITMVPDNFHRTDKVEVHGDVFQGPDSAAVNEINLTSSEIKEASTVFADDPFRAVQALPGVSAADNNELMAEFSVMGAPFDSVGLYLDGVLLPRPFHAVQNVTNGASLSLLTSEIVDDLKLLPVAYPQKFGDDVGAALEMTTRDGSRTRPLFRASIGLADSDFLGEGELGHSKKGSWLASGRKSYLGYLVNDRVQNFSDISFYDASLKLTYDISPHHNLSFHGLGGHTNVVRSEDSSDPEFVKRGTSDFIFARAGWRWAVNPQLLVDSRTAFIRQPVDQRNQSGLAFDRESYSEWSAGGDVVWSWQRDSVLEGGWALRRLQDHSTYIPGASPLGPLVVKQAILRGDAYVQQASSFLNNRVHVLGSLRWDGREKLDSNPVSVQGSLAVQLARATQLSFAAGRYNQFQFPDASPPSSTVDGCIFGNQSYQRANHYSAAIEQRVGENIRVRGEAFDREGENVTVLSANAACPPQVLRGTFPVRHFYSRGAQFILQRRSANRLSGWLGYTLVFARQNDFFLSTTEQFYSPYYTSPSDQRHTVNAFASYRLTPTVNLSGKALYGSGFPGSTGLMSGPGGTVVPEPVLRVGPYERLDIRIDKTWAFRHWKTTLYTEVLNLTNHNNRIVTGFENMNGQLVIGTQRALPITPTAGLVFEF
jgi:Carboxypeptidase regulatory-like domain